MKPPFLNAPGRWTKATRIAQTPAEYASAYEGHIELKSSWEGKLITLCSVATAIGCAWIVFH